MIVVLRLASMMMIIVGLYAAAQTIMQVLNFGGLNALTIYYDAGFSWFGVSIGALVPGFGLAILSGRLAIWVTPMPRRECLRCGYQLRNLQADACPECATPID